jgi:hypothetical protein
MRIRSSILAFAILMLLVIPSIFAMGAYLNVFGNTNSQVLSSSSGDPSAYSESLNLYVTSAQSMWMATLTGGNISLGVTIPSSVSSFNVSLTHYASWNSQYEVFTKYGFGYLGTEEPMPNETLLSISTTSQSDANSLASALGQEFAQSFLPFSNTTDSYVYVSPMDFTTEMHIYFWNLLPQSAGGFANMTTQSSFMSQSFVFYNVEYSGSSYSISYGGIQSLSSASPFSLYSQLGLTAPLNYSSDATNSSVSVHVLGGFVSSNTTSYSNDQTTFSAVINAPPRSSGNLTMPNLTANLDFSIPTIVAYRQVTPSLTPSTGTTLTVTVTVKDISPSGSPPANVSLDDDWYGSAFNKTLGSPMSNFTISPGETNSNTSYALKVLNSGNFVLPQTLVTYTYELANQSFKANTYLNNETMFVGDSSDASLEAIQDVNSAAGQPVSSSVTVTNLGATTAFNVNVAGHDLGNIGAHGGTANITIPAAPSSIRQTNASISYNVVWTNGNGLTNSTSTNTINTAYALGNPATPDTSISKSVSVSSDKTYSNITLILTNSGTQSLTNLTVFDPIPSGMSFGHTVGNLSSGVTLTSKPDSVSLLIANVSAGASVTYEYNVTISNPNDNYVVSPANVSVNWNGVSIVHYSQGAGLPLGVTSTKNISPSAGFLGTNSTEQLSVTNKGSLPIYFVNFANTTDTFLTPINSSSFKTVPVLAPGNSLNSTLDVNMSGTPGTYNSSATAAAFIFSGINQTAPSNIFRVTIYQVVTASLSTSSPKIEEDHDITITVTVDNPSNVTVSGVDYSTKLPSYLDYLAGNLTFSIPSLGPNQTVKSSFTFKTDIPYSYTIPGGNLTFQYQSKTLKGTTAPLTLNIADDLTIRYAIPIFVGLLIVIGTVFYARRLVRRAPS